MCAQEENIDRRSKNGGRQRAEVQVKMNDYKRSGEEEY